MIVPPPAKGQPFEMQASALRVIGWVDDPDTYPIQPKPHTLEYLREVAHLRPHTNVIGAATRVRHTLAKGDPPVLRRARIFLGQYACYHRLRPGEGGGIYCLALTKVYTFGPTFRAENSNTSRHLAEFWRSSRRSPSPISRTMRHWRKRS